MKFILLFLLSAPTYADSLNLGLIGLTSHINSANDASWQYMKRKVSKTAYTVWHPEFNLTFEKSKFLLNFTYLKDCQDFDAYYLGAGYRLNITDTFYTNLMVGAYKRTSYYLINGAPNHLIHQILFVPWIGIQKDFMITKEFGTFISLNTNYYLTHTFAGIKYKF